MGRKTQAFTDAPNRRLFEDAPPTQKSRSQDYPVRKQRKPSRHPQQSHEEAVRIRCEEWRNMPPRIPFKDTQEYKDRVRREEGHRAANFYQDPLPQRSGPSAPLGNPDEIRRREEEEFDNRMWDNIRWRMRGVHPSNPAYRKMERSLLDAWAADKEMWKNNRANYEGMRSNMRRRDEYEMPRQKEIDRPEEKTFSIKDLKGFMVEAVDHNADLAACREEEEEERKRDSKRREEYRREEREEEERRLAIPREQREKEEREKREKWQKDKAYLEAKSNTTFGGPAGTSGA